MHASLTFLLFSIFAALTPVWGQDLAHQRRRSVQPWSADSLRATLPLRDALAILSQRYRVHILYDDSLAVDRVAHLPAQFSGDLYRDLYDLLEQYPVAIQKIGRRTLVLTPAFAGGGAGSERSARIAGRILDTTGRPIPDAQVVVEGTIFGAAADPEGRFMIDNLPPGLYDLRTRVIGYRNKQMHIALLAGRVDTAEFVLEPDILDMNEIVVTGMRNPLTKIASSVAISTANAEQIALRAPRSTADLLKVIPGFYVESSGGEGGNNLFSRGLPADGSFRYVAVFEDGLPAYEQPELAFANIDAFIRVDETLAVLEGMRGGTGSLFASNAPAGIINFVSKTGGQVPSGSIKFSTALHGLFRTDVSYGGPLGRTWRFHAGGFYRYDRGVRAPGFVANHGGQFKANLTRLLDAGYLRFYAKYLNDRNIFYVPIPLQDAHHPRSIPGFSAQYGTLASADIDLIKVPVPNGSTMEFDLRDGIHPRQVALGAETEMEILPGWSIKNSARVMAADLQFNAIFSLYNPMPAPVFAQKWLEQFPEANSYRYTYTHSPDASFEPAPGNDLIVETGWWAVKKPLRNFINHLQLTHTFRHHALTAGLYVSDYTAEDFWYWHNVLMEVRHQPRVLDLTLLDAAGRPLHHVTREGFTRYGTAYVNAKHHGITVATYLNEEWQATDHLHLEGGLRLDFTSLDGSMENVRLFNLGDSTTLADDRVAFGDGSFQPYRSTYRAWAFSAGGNYRFDDGHAVYARLSRGYRMPDFDQFITVGAADSQRIDKGTIEHVRQAECGLKISTPRFALFGAAFLIELDNLAFNDEGIDPKTGELRTLRRFANSRTVGLELEASFRPSTSFEFSLTSTLQNPRIRNFTRTIDDRQLNFSGNLVRRIPQILVDITAGYGWNGFRFLLNPRFVGRRFADEANTVILPAYSELHAGITYRFSNVTLSLHGQNLLNTVGLTEGNPRLGQIVGSSQPIYMARPILGRSFTFSAAYSF